MQDYRLVVQEDPVDASRLRTALIGHTWFKKDHKYIFDREPSEKI